MRVRGELLGRNRRWKAIAIGVEGQSTVLGLEIHMEVCFQGSTGLMYSLWDPIPNVVGPDSVGIFLTPCSSRY